MKLIDLVGKKFGRLCVVKRIENKRGRPCWLCVCECGKECKISGIELRKNETKSCGCLRREKLSRDLKGKIFGKLKVLKLGDRRGSSKCNFWECKCICGNLHNVSSQHLITGQVRSCGCWYDEQKLLENAVKRFNDNIEKTESCWIWKGSLSRGYGMIFYKKNMRAHRFSYFIHIGKLLMNYLVCHTCDNKLCVNPDHLYLGTPKDNSRDATERKRLKVGSDHHFSKLSDKDVNEIIKSSESGVSLSEKFGISKTHVSRIRNKKNWIHAHN